MLNKPLVTFNTSKLFANILRATQNIMRFNLQKFWCSVLYMTFRYFKLVYVTLRCFKLTEICFQKKKKKVNKNLCGLVFKTSSDYLDPKKQSNIERILDTLMEKKREKKLEQTYLEFRMLLNNIIYISTHFFTHTYFKKLQTILFKLLYQTCPKILGFILILKSNCMRFIIFIM